MGCHVPPFSSILFSSTQDCFYWVPVMMGRVRQDPNFSGCSFACLQTRLGQSISNSSASEDCLRAVEKPLHILDPGDSSAVVLQPGPGVCILKQPPGHWVQIVWRTHLEKRCMRWSPELYVCKLMYESPSCGHQGGVSLEDKSLLALQEKRVGVSHSGLFPQRESQPGG